MESFVSTSIQTSRKCPACSHEAIEGTRFCSKCGAQFFNSVEGLASLPGSNEYSSCKKCGKHSDYNLKFCISCGTSLVGEQSPSAPKRRKTLRWEKSTSASEPKTQPASRPEATEKDARGAQLRPPANSRTSVTSGFSAASRELVAPALGIVLGVGILFAINALKIQPVLERLAWSTHSLVVYAAPTGSRVRVEEAQKRSIAAGLISDRGMVSFDNLQEGEYGLFVEKAGHKTFYGSINIQKGRPTVVGYPQAIELASQ